MSKSMLAAILVLTYILNVTSATNPTILNGNTTTSSSLPANYQHYLRQQPNDIRFVCRWQPRFDIPTINGNITVTCLTNQTVIGQQIRNHFQKTDQSLSQETLNDLQIKSSAYVARDSYVSLCMLSCSQGKPYTRHSELTSAGVLEPNDVNIGCDDRTNMKCRGTCPSSNFAVRHGFVRCTSESFAGSRCVVDCRPNYAPSGPHERVCNPNNLRWEPENPFVCQAFCPSVPSVANGDVTCTNNRFAGSMCSLNCHSGYKVKGSPRKLCFHQRWLPISPFKCERDLSCNALPQVANGRLNCSNGANLFSRCSFSCEEGYSPVGPAEQWCVQTRNLTSLWFVARRKNVPGFSEATSVMRCIENTAILTSVRKASTDEFVQLKRMSACAIPHSRKQICGGINKNRQQCESNNCCWDPIVISPIPCYRPDRRHFPWPTQAQAPPPSPQNDRRLPSFQEILGSLANYRGSTSLPRRQQLMCGCTFSNPHLGTCTNSPSTPSPSPPILPSGNQVVLGSALTNGMNQKSLRLSEQRVYLGNDASPTDWPWHAVVIFDPNLCGGTLISPLYVITAAHCITNYESSQASGMIAFGVRNISNLDQDADQIRRSVAVVRHQNFSLTSDGHSRNDLAIIKLNSPVDISGRYAKPLCLPDVRVPEANDECYVTGFGKISGAGRRSQILQQACVPLMPMTQCQIYYNSYVIPVQHLCAGEERLNSPDTCKGDSGGPLVCRRPGSGRCGWYLAGITSFGRTPCGTGIPSVYMNIFQYQSWIYATIQTLGRTRSLM